MAMTIEYVRTVRAELQKFDARQTDFVVRFHIAVADTNLRAAAEGHDGPIFRESLAICVRQLAVCVSNPGRGCGSMRCLFLPSGIEGNGIKPYRSEAANEAASSYRAGRKFSRFGSFGTQGYCRGASAHRIRGECTSCTAGAELAAAMRKTSVATTGWVSKWRRISILIETKAAEAALLELSVRQQNTLSPIFDTGQSLGQLLISARI
jgi:hypothetical protein